jgi:hypothetical protein
MPAAPTQGSRPPSNTPIRSPAAKGRSASAGVPLACWLPLAREVRLVGPGRATRSGPGRPSSPRHGPYRKPPGPRRRSPGGLEGRIGHVFHPPAATRPRSLYPSVGHFKPWAQDRRGAVSHGGDRPFTRWPGLVAAAPEEPAQESRLDGRTDHVRHTDPGATSTRRLLAQTRRTRAR